MLNNLKPGITINLSLLIDSATLNSVSTSLPVIFESLLWFFSVLFLLIICEPSSLIKFCALFFDNAFSVFLRNPGKSVILITFSFLLTTGGDLL